MMDSKFNLVPGYTSFNMIELPPVKDLIKEINDRLGYFEYF